jgi:hypothetical protein
MVTYADTTASGRHLVVLTAHLDPGLTRWKWLVKWFLLSFLWPAFLVVTVIAGFCILVSGRYPPFRLDQGGTEPTPPPLPPTAGPAVPPLPEPAGTWTGA